MTRRRRAAGFKRVGPGSLLTKLTVKVYRCNGCGAVHRDKKPVQCQCGRMDFTFIHSEAEAKRLAELELMVKAGMISDLQTQVRFSLNACAQDGSGPVKVGDYIADFVYIEHGERVIEDVKGGVIEPLAEWKLRHMEAQYGRPVKLVKIT